MCRGDYGGIGASRVPAVHTAYSEHQNRCRTMCVYEVGKKAHIWRRLAVFAQQRCAMNAICWYVLILNEEREKKRIHPWNKCEEWENLLSRNEHKYIILAKHRRWIQFISFGACRFSVLVECDDVWIQEGAMGSENWRKESLPHCYNNNNNANFDIFCIDLYVSRLMLIRVPPKVWVVWGRVEMPKWKLVHTSARHNFLLGPRADCQDDWSASHKCVLLPFLNPKRCVMVVSMHVNVWIMFAYITGLCRLFCLCPRMCLALSALHYDWRIYSEVVFFFFFVKHYPCVLWAN